MNESERGTTAEQEPDAAAPPAATQKPAAAPRETVVLRVACGVLAALAVVTTVLYVQERGESAERKRDLTARSAQAARLQAELDEVRGKRAEFERRVTELEAKALDPKGYEQIQKCVRQYAEMERQIAEIIKNPPTDVTAVPDGARVEYRPFGVTQAPTDCVEAEKYLK
jgi:uncharacterized protein HemX